MVKQVLFCCAAIFLASCNEQPKEAEQQAAFDVTSFEIDAFTERVHQFLKKRKETKAYPNYKALFVNTENCSACMKGSFEGISPFLSAVDERTFVYFNDSSILQIAPENKQLEFVCLPAETFHSAAIFHSKMYLYTVRGNRIESLDLVLKHIDSLNSSGTK
jgi:hypothetical protein